MASGLMTRLWEAVKPRSKEKKKKTSHIEVSLDEITDIAHINLRGKRLMESVFPGVNIDEGTEFDDKFFVQIDKGAPFDLSSQQIHLSQRYSLRAYRSIVWGKRSVELLKDFAIGDGIRFSAIDPKVDALLKKHWLVNEWEDNIEERVRSLGIFGELLMPAFVSDDGMVKMTTISSFKIVRINRSKDDAEKTVSATTTPLAARATGQAASDADKLVTWEFIKPDNKGVLKGEAFYFAVNRISGSTRGLPDSLASLDWLDGHDNYVFSLLERANLAQNVVFDLEIESADADLQTEIKKQFIESMRAGTVFTHNEKVTLTLKVPDMAASDAQTVSGIFRKQIQAGTGWAGLFFGDSDDLTRSSASELSIPVAKMVQNRQNFIKRMLIKIFQYQIEQAEVKGKLSGVTNFSFAVEMPKVYLRDVSVMTKSLVDLAILENAVTNDWITQEEASHLFRLVAEQIGPLPTQEERESPESIEPELKPVIKAMNRVRQLVNVKSNGSKDGA